MAFLSIPSWLQSMYIGIEGVGVVDTHFKVSTNISNKVGMFKYWMNRLYLFYVNTDVSSSYSFMILSM